MRILRVFRNRVRFLIIFLLSFVGIYLFYEFLSEPQQADKFSSSSTLWNTFYNYEKDPNLAKINAFDLIEKHLGGKWKDVHFKDFRFKKLSGGFSNLVFKCYAEPDLAVLLKIEFSKTHEERKREFSIIKAMSDAKQGPSLLASFHGGRIEQFIPSRVITTEEFRNTGFAFELGRKVAEMHNVPYKGAYRNEYIDMMRDYLSRIIATGATTFFVNTTLPINNYPRTVNVAMLEKELDKLEVYMKRRFGKPLSLIHNDIFEPNVLIVKSAQTKSGRAEKSMMLIDYEFGMLGHRAADLTSYFTDFTNDPNRKVAENQKENHKTFCYGYLNRTYELFPATGLLKSLQLSGDISKDTLILLREAQDHTQFNHMFWGLENLLYHLEGNTQLDYEKSYRDRLAAYYSSKHF